MNLVKNFYKDITKENITNGFVAFLFAVTGPVAIMLLVGTKTNLTNQELSSWLFGAFAINSVISIFFSFWYKQPLVFMWSIPGIILIGSSIENYSFNEIVGAYILTGIFLYLDDHICQPRYLSLLRLRLRLQHCLLILLQNQRCL